MKSPTASNDKSRQPRRLTSRGFTLIELLIVIGLVAIVVSTGLFFDFDSFRANTFYTERDTLISALQHARSEAISNICRGPCGSGVPHGVKILPSKFVLFQGDNYNSGDIYNAELDANSNITHSGDNEVVFAQLSGDVASSKQIILIDPGSNRQTTIDINIEGQILWQDSRF